MDRMVAEVVLREREDEVRKADQEIRARALECAVETMTLAKPLKANSPADIDAFWDLVHRFEAYIRDG